MSLDKALRKAVAGTMVAVASLLPLALAQAAPALTEFVKAGAATTTLWDVNNLGHMVGSSTSGTAPTDFPVAFVYDGATFTTIMPAGAVSSSALGISDGGVVVGSYFSSYTDDGAGNIVPGPSLGFIYSGGTYTTFTVAGAENTYLRGISPNGRYLSGYYSTATSAPGFVYDTVTSTFTVVSTPASLITIPQGINGSGILVGSDVISGPPTTRPGFTWDIATGTRTDYVLAGAVRTAFRSIDDAGTLAGWFIDAGGATHGFVGTVASFEQVDFPGADSTFVEGSNNAGVLVGNYFVGDTSHAFVTTNLPSLLLQTLAANVVGVGPGRSLAGKVGQAQSYYAAGNIGAACTMLTDFINEVRAQRGKKIAAATADALIADARAIMSAMGCS